MGTISTRIYKLSTLLLVAYLIGCASPSPIQERIRFGNDPTFSDRMEKVFNPPWWYHGPVKTIYNKMYPPTWYQGSLEWMLVEVKEVCDAKVEAMVKATASAAIGLATPSPIAVVFGVVRVAGTGGIVTYCKLKELEA